MQEAFPIVGGVLKIISYHKNLPFKGLSDVEEGIGGSGPWYIVGRNLAVHNRSISSAAHADTFLGNKSAVRTREETGA